MDLGIRGKVALVTGAARSLGKADAQALAAEGCAIAILDLDGDGAAGAAGEIEASGGRARGYACDIRESAQIQDVVSRVEHDLGPVDICVNNAGLIYTVAQLKDMKDEDWELNLAVNVTGTYKVTKAVFPGMRERRWGRIVCMASIAGLMGGFGQTAYATSKIGLIGFAKSVALEGARYNVTCNAIAPGIIAPNAKLSPLYERMVKRVAMQREGEPEDVANAVAFLCSERARYNVTCNAIAPGIIAPNAKLSPLYERMVKRVAMQREGEPEDVANAVAFLCSERARYITGAVLTVTGGMDLFTF
jgi:3-oxoacyl-[acyl-carrier protein] reductase